MASNSLFQIGRVLTGRRSTYTILKELHRAATADQSAVYLAIDSFDEKCIVKSVHGHWRLQNEAKILNHYQSKTRHLRPLLDEILPEDPADPPSIVLRHLDSELLTESNNKRLTRPEIKQVARGVLEALRVLHKDGMVHTDVKLDNIFVNYGEDGKRFSEIQLGDCGGVVHKDSHFAREGHLIGGSTSRSPEALFQLHWGTPTDVWSFGNAILSLIHGSNYHQFDPRNEGIMPDHEAYDYTVVKRMYDSFGPFPPKMKEIIASEDVNVILKFLNDQGPPMKPFERWTTRQIPAADNAFIRRVLKLDPRDRPSVEEILEDEWFTEESEDTRKP
ncbi:uncharacterized protein CTHT_0070000 [Thermochaetoides thermophila DSM 1495]|uniref:non-specific serine/threonine protein kinase n=1 Tax=Chaetomium thermophilum (strain DSM 1495 / CBS 144.50 / IMI 039719) TaxID=759272 RepID=G0SHH1_CHATD|nr:hypothetical protein CTHT_0070000 [Thermochaetoides thermophila DSM 1495]EGS17660.1 hypothetical protein CTHT_0070000 [Thermochaetoides thermophila DSM 1495]